MTEALALLGFVLPLGLDSFAVAAAVGAAGTLPARVRWRITALFVVFEAGMPLVGLALGAPVARAIGPVANYVVVAVGLWMLLHDEDDEEEKAERLVTARGAALLGLGVSISLDELAIGFGLGLTHLPLLPVIVGIAAQAFIATQLGLWLGAHVAERFREAAERLAGIVLVVMGVVLAVEQLIG
ncbi:manganese efflux pump MntP family protein [Kutzneria kofuensis]|uniref:Putative Mn2+ efflux pump MntP n=1 Tax=Kutzneria kofuensis TaxID=103725 RepID=A0A7W9NKW8_9PSEU|nr:manganese efflux pump [Kutzneria kofuensis]MBB5896139.1 putative Mn2+ efflux pump MntP [Kutzneria kofuensis]